jgi:hypothetical protein
MEITLCRIKRYLSVTFFILLSIVLLFSTEVFGSEKSHATFRVENVGPTGQIDGQSIGSLPSTNELTSVSIFICGVILILMVRIFYSLKKGTLYEK